MPSSDRIRAGKKLLEADILRLLAEGPRKAAEIASKLGVDRSLVNGLLYGRLSGKVEQNKSSYRWQLKQPGQASQVDPTAVRNRFAPLFAYYLDCLAADADVAVSVFATTKFGLDYAQLDRWPDEGDDWREQENVRRLVGLQHRQPKAKALWLGWPVLYRLARGRNGWEGAFVEPVLIWSIESEADPVRLANEPTINMAALERLTGEGSPLLAAAELTEALGLDDVEEVEPADLGARLHHLHPDWPWVVQPDPDIIGQSPRLDGDDVASGLHNAAVIILSDRTTFTAGLELELKQLQSVGEREITRSSLGGLLGNVLQTALVDEKPVLEVVPLNVEQREAVAKALKLPLTVITGPPGTGKSQVVTAILANAAYHGMRVLFASRNNQAVDVVEERVNSLSARPLLLRLGAKSAQAALADRLMRLLSTRPSPDEREKGQHAADRVRTISSLLAALDDRLERLRVLANEVAALDASLAPFRERLGTERWTTLSSFDEASARIDLHALKYASRRSMRSVQPWPVRAVWPFLREQRQRDLAAAVSKVEPLGASFGIGAELPSLLAELPAAIEQAVEAKALWDNRSALSALGDPGRIAAERSALQSALGYESRTAFEGWLAGVADRLDPSQRQALGDYVALLRSIAAANETNSPIAKKIWARYYQLADIAAQALPGWAVTSLSARGRIPFTSSLFDLVVIDEASQCDIASVLPLLFRAKRAVIIGDPQQLSHITKLSQERDQSLMVRHGVLDDPGPGWAYGKASLYNLAASRVPADAMVQLRDHHRSHPAIIQFSNERFYEGTLRVATDYRRLIRPEGEALRWIDIAGTVERPQDGGAFNDTEAQAIVAELRRLVLEQKYPGTVGVVTPFRAQGRRIREHVSRDPALNTVLAARDFLAETADKYQGDERDLMIFSPVLSRGISRGAAGFLAREANRFNVALTRARAALVIVGDRAACAGGDVPLLAEYAAYFDRHKAEEARPEPRASGSAEYPKVDRPENVSDWERLFYCALVAVQIFPIPQYPVDQYNLDLAIVLENGRRLDIEVDGERYHRDPWSGENVRRDQLRDMRLMEMGWDVRRFWVPEIRDHLDDCVADIRRWASETAVNRQ